VLYVLSRSRTPRTVLSRTALRPRLSQKEKLRDFVIPLQIDDLRMAIYHRDHARQRCRLRNPGRRACQLLDKLEEDAFQDPNLTGRRYDWWRTQFSAEQDAQGARGPSNWFRLRCHTCYFHSLSRRSIASWRCLRHFVSQLRRNVPDTFAEASDLKENSARNVHRKAASRRVAACWQNPNPSWEHLFQLLRVAGSRSRRAQLPSMSWPTRPNALLPRPVVRQVFFPA